MKRLYILSLAIAVICGQGAAPAPGKPAGASAERPNVLVIMADDLASNELSCYGGRNLVTRNIDRLAAEGLRFTRMYASEAICVPTRASLFTGLYPVRHGSYQNHKPVSRNNLKSIAHYLPAGGYRVGLAGKNHSTKPREVFPFEMVPGFEPNCVSPKDDYTLDGIRDFMSAGSQPFCLFVMSINPHRPWTQGDPGEFNPDSIRLPRNLADTRKTREEFCKFLAEVRRLDNQVGDVLKTLEETGKAENTLVLFLGEQGPQFPGGKWTCWEPGTHSSMIARLPGVIRPNTVTGAIVQYEDILPTLLKLAEAPAVKDIDGRSFLPVLSGKSATHRTYAYGIHNNIPEGNPYPIRSIQDTRYKLILNLMPDSAYYIKYSMNPAMTGNLWASWQQQAAQDTSARFLVNRVVHRPPVELYDLEADPWEMNNLALHPSPQQEKIIQQLRKQLERWMQQQGDPGAALDVPFKRS